MARPMRGNNHRYELGLSQFIRPDCIPEFIAFYSELLPSFAFEEDLLTYQTDVSTRRRSFTAANPVHISQDRILPQSAMLILKTGPLSF